MSRNPGNQAVFQRFLGIGIVIVAGIAILIFGSTKTVRPAGEAPMRMQLLIEEIAASNGGRVLPKACTMMGNINLGVSCKVGGLHHGTLRDALLKDGWQQTPGPPLQSVDEHAAFVRGDDHISFDSNRERLVILIAVRKRRH